MGVQVNALLLLLLLSKSLVRFRLGWLRFFCIAGGVDRRSHDSRPIENCFERTAKEETDRAGRLSAGHSDREQRGQTRLSKHHDKAKTPSDMAQVLYRQN